MRKAKVISDVIGNEEGDIVDVYTVDEAIEIEPFNTKYFESFRDSPHEGFVECGKGRGLYAVFSGGIEYLEEE